MKSAVCALVPNPIRAEAVVAELRMSDFSADDISVLFPDKGGFEELARGKFTKAPQGAAIGAGAGGAVGGAAGWMLGLSTLSMPGIGPVIAMGPILGALSGMAVGAAAGSLGGAFIGLGFPEYEAKLYEGKLHEGYILIAAHTDDIEEVKLVREIFERADAEEISVTPENALTK